MSSSVNRPLTFELITQKAKCHNFKFIDKLNFWGSSLGDITIISELKNLKVLSLTMNKITTLQPLASCEKLEEIYMRKNLIPNLSEVTHLKNLPNLRILWLSENPCCTDPNYRAKVAAALPQLAKLDDIAISPQEREMGKNLIVEEERNYHTEERNYHEEEIPRFVEPAVRVEPLSEQSSPKKRVNKWRRKKTKKKLEAVEDVIPSKLKQISSLSEAPVRREEMKVPDATGVAEGKQIFDSFKRTDNLKGLRYDRGQAKPDNKVLDAINLLLPDLNLEELKYVLYEVGLRVENLGN